MFYQMFPYAEGIVRKNIMFALFFFSFLHAPVCVISIFSFWLQLFTPRVELSHMFPLYSYILDHYLE